MFGNSQIRLSFVQNSTNTRPRAPPVTRTGGLSSWQVCSKPWPLRCQAYNDTTISCSKLAGIPQSLPTGLLLS